MTEFFIMDGFSKKNVMIARETVENSCDATHPNDLLSKRHIKRLLLSVSIHKCNDELIHTLAERLDVSSSVRLSRNPRP